ncbi:MAG: hypothetical protein K2K29_00310, partial [Muribaculaceae bacterium]|nr:hypothetical protein [Muribaculaceae bacterium]
MIDNYKGDAILKIEKAGLESYSQNLIVGDEDLDIGECFLTEVSTLQELVVEGATVVATDGNMLYTPTKLSVEASTYAADLIGKLGIPALRYNPKERTLESYRGTPVILIDGRPADMTELQSLNASDVMNVEYSNNVPALYGEGDFLINVKLKKKDNGGSWNIYENNDFLGSMVYAQTSLRMHQGSSSWLLNGTFNYNNNQDTYDNKSTNYLNPQLPVELRESSHSPFNYKWYDVILQYNFIPSTDFMLSATYKFNTYSTLRKSYSEYIDNYLGKTEEYTGYNRTHRENPTHSLNVYLSKDINSNNTIDVNVLGTAMNQPYESEFSYDKPSGLLEYRDDVKAKRYSLLSGVNCNHIFNDRSKLGICYLLTLSTNTNKYP